MPPYQNTRKQSKRPLPTELTNLDGTLYIMKQVVIFHISFTTINFFHLETINFMLKQKKKNLQKILMYTKI